MSEDAKTILARRPVLGVLAAILGVAAAGGIAYEIGVFAPSWPGTPYDDLLAELPDRTDAVVMGKAVLHDDPGFDATAVAAVLRLRMKNISFGALIDADIQANGLTEMQGWVLPTSLAQMSALAASAAPARPE